ncbi:class A beta-lactamase-related serine hydrolase [Ktedonosporobacter rubrisoli]|uniref:Class A beta-lactamase-related serine hydrolase n=1 Tax=Ktedonosporobacter rubrisoli TaxID=2509675 RepID=A0A4P6JUX8_KTERU|nr:serine hydrolase domain-containing protein [Ktedonosporobacter rubrisoli]QBD79153.1 class A beta-lactamase-related serine hydrolase [Ktedonosporobacter rubrisoli]
MATPNDLVRRTLAGVQQHIAELATRLQVPGVAVGLLHQGEEAWTSYGVTRIDNLQPITPETLFQVASITKPVVASVIMRLAEMNKLDVKAPIRRYIPDLHLADENVAQQVTCMHLLTHTAGWVGDLWLDTGEDSDALAKYVNHLGTLSQEYPLGEVYSYNNVGFSLLGRVIEVVTGQAFERAMQHFLFDPLEMTQTSFLPGETMTKHRTIGHEVWDGVLKIVPGDAQFRSTYPAGGMVTSVADLLRFARFHLGQGITRNGTRLLSEEAIAAMQKPYFARSQGWIGLAWEIDDLNGMRAIGHGGITSGQVSSLQLLPERQFALAILTNGSRGSALIAELVPWLRLHILGLVEPLPTFLGMTREDLASYEGVYDSSLSRTEVRLVDEGLVIISQFKGGYPTRETPGGPPQPPRRIAFCGKDRVVILEPPWKGSQLTFIRKPDGAIGYLQTGHLLRKI